MVTKKRNYKANRGFGKGFDPFLGFSYLFNIFTFKIMTRVKGN